MFVLLSYLFYDWGWGWYKNKQTNKQTLNYLVNAWTFYMFVLLLVVSFYVVDMFGTQKASKYI